MKLKIYHSAFLIPLLFALGSGQVMAQEDKSHPDLENAPVIKTDSEPIPSIDLEVRSSKLPVSTASDLIMRDAELVKNNKAGAAKTTEKPQKEEETLSFNFLYYLIEKFKLSDLVE